MKHLKKWNIFESIDDVSFLESPKSSNSFFQIDESYYRNMNIKNIDKWMVSEITSNIGFFKRFFSDIKFRVGKFPDGFHDSSLKIKIESPTLSWWICESALNKFYIKKSDNTYWCCNNLEGLKDYLRSEEIIK